MNFEILSVIICIVFCINIYVSIYLIKRDDIDSFQKKSQIILVWLIPILASVALLLFYRSQDLPVKSASDYATDNSVQGESGS